MSAQGMMCPQSYRYSMCTCLCLCLKHMRTSMTFLDAEKQVNALDITPDKQLIAAAGKELLSNMYLAFP